MRMLRVPYIYLPHKHLFGLRVMSVKLLKIIHDVHHDIPNHEWFEPHVPVYMYHPSFLRWVYAKVTTELARRGYSVRKLDDKLIQLKSRPLSEWLPPTEDEIAEDVAWLLQQWKHKLLPGGERLPRSYVELAERIYGHTPEQEACARVADSSGRHRDADFGWYYLQGQEASQVCDDSLAKGVRRSRYGAT